MTVSKEFTFYTGVNTLPKQNNAAYKIPSSKTESKTVYNSRTHFY